MDERPRTSTILLSLESKPSASTTFRHIHIMLGAFKDSRPHSVASTYLRGWPNPDAFVFAVGLEPTRGPIESEYPQVAPAYKASMSTVFIIRNLATPVRIELTPLSSKPSHLPLKVRGNNLVPIERVELSCASAAGLKSAVYSIPPYRHNLARPVRVSTFH